MKIGRSNDYKHDSDSLYIGDLKVPKKYIIVNVGSLSLRDTSKTPLLITFQSICTTDVHGEIIKLPTKESEPITRDFTERDELLLRVNSNKSDRIQIRIEWHDIVIFPFLKKVLFNDQIQESPLPSIVEELHNNKVDIRSTSSPFDCTHYLTFADHVDFNLKIAVLRAVPVVTTKWTTEMHDRNEVHLWLLDLNKECLLPNTQDNYSMPDISRSQLLGGSHAVVLHSGQVLKAVNRLHSWLGCLGAQDVVLKQINSENNVTILSELNEIASNEKLYVFIPLDEELAPSFLDKDQCNNSSLLWKAVTSKERRRLFLFKHKALQSGKHSQPESLSLRIKRRRIERVDDTQFFQFSQALPTPDTLKTSQPPPADPEPVPAPAESELPSKTASSNEIQVQETQPVEETIHETKGDIGSENSEDEPDHAQTSEINERKRVTELELPESKRPKTEESERHWIKPHVSLANAIKSTKEEATDTVKKELGLDEPSEINEKLGQMVIVEEVDNLLRRNRKVNSVPPNRSYEGRKNFKTFKKNGPRANNVTRTFIELQDESNDIYFADHFIQPTVQPSKRLEQDFSKEMPSVKGYQPQPSQLFVKEEELQLEDDQVFSFLNNRGGAAGREAITQPQSDDDDDEFKFTFSRR